jgi:hypothetical protein
VVITLNHPSWWDPLVCAVLAGLFPGRCHYAPIEAAALRRYRFFERLGFFGVEPGTVRGARSFLRTGQAILGRPESVLWITAQGRFADPRERPLCLRPGIGHLLACAGQGMILPLALEYPFWEESAPEALARFGAPLPVSPALARPPGEWAALVEQELAATQDVLAREACRRDPAAFTTVLGGRAGVGGLYDLWRRLLAQLRGEEFSPEHGGSAPRRQSC